MVRNGYNYLNYGNYMRLYTHVSARLPESELLGADSVRTSLGGLLMPRLELTTPNMAWGKTRNASWPGVVGQWYERSIVLNSHFQWCAPNGPVIHGAHPLLGSYHLSPCLYLVRGLVGHHGLKLGCKTQRLNDFRKMTVSRREPASMEDDEQ